MNYFEKSGTVIGVNDEFCEMYLQNGWRLMRDDAPAPIEEPPKAPKKSATKKKSSAKKKVEE